MLRGFSSSSCRLCSYASSCFLASICPPGPWTAAQCVSWWLQGLWGEFARKKRGRGPAGPLHTHRCLSFTPAVLQHSKEKAFSFSLSCSFCSACGGRNVGVKWALSCVCLHAGLLYDSRTVYSLGDLHSLWASDFSPLMCNIDPEGELNLIYSSNSGITMLPGTDTTPIVSPQRNLCWGEAATSHLTLWLYVTGVSCRAEIVTVWQADSRGLESRDLAGSLCVSVIVVCV